jgi:hypothetical protein
MEFYQTTRKGKLSHKDLYNSACAERGRVKATNIQQSDAHLEILYRLKALALTSE